MAVSRARIGDQNDDQAHGFVDEDGSEGREAEHAEQQGQPELGVA
ncbi:MAG TPA: hypothetical protein VM429_01080 [Micropruina sp.]|jgi:hypothetical protein|nr:hypothetical protein [Micropruina sp.]